MVCANNMIGSCTDTGIHLLVPNRWQAHVPFRQLLTGGASEIGGTPRRNGNLRKRIEWETTQNFPFRVRTLELAARFEQFVRWNIPTLKPGYVPFRIDGRFWGRSVYHAPEDLDRAFERIKALVRFLRYRGIPVLYVRPPRRTLTTDRLAFSVFDFESETDENISRRLDEIGIPVLNLDSVMLGHHQDKKSFFYGSDHHLRNNASRWAGLAIMTRLVDNGWTCDFNFNSLEDRCFTESVFPNAFLGSFSRKATLAACPSDDFSIPARMDGGGSFELETISQDGKRTIETGDYSMLLDDAIPIDHVPSYRTLSLYSVFLRQNPPLTVIRNKTHPNGPRILLFSDSLDNAMLVFLACGAGEIASVDNREGLIPVSVLLDGRSFDAAVVMYDGFPYEALVNSLPHSEPQPINISQQNR